MTTALAEKQCIPCEGGEPALRGEALAALHARLGEGWDVVDDHHLARQFTFADFAEALAFTNRVGEVAEEQNHHPTITLTWGKAVVVVYTHKIDGLTESDFVFAAKTDAVK